MLVPYVVVIMLDSLRPNFIKVRFLCLSKKAKNKARRR